MSEQNKADRWSQLASDLGVEAAPQETRPEKPLSSEETSEPVEQVSAKPTPPVRTPPAEPRKRPSDWMQLASELGLELPPEAFQSEPQPASEPPQVEKSGSVAAEVPWTRPEPAKSAWSESKEDFSAEAIEDPTETEDEVADAWQGEVEVVESRSETEERKPRRRRKRRRKVRRSGELARLEEPAKSPGDPIESSELVEMVELVTDPESELLDAPEEGSEAAMEEAEQEAPKRSKRRRRRRSGRKKGAGTTEQTSQAEPRPAASEEPQVRERDDLDELEDEDDDESETRGSSDRRREKMKAIHRGIPSWHEAIDVVIATNMEARAKHPERASYNRPRGGRNRSGRERPSSDRQG